MESHHNVAKEAKVKIENTEEEMKRKLKKDSGKIPPDDSKDLEEPGAITDLGELVDTSCENASINFNSMLSDFFPADEEKVKVNTSYVHDEKETVDPPLVLPLTNPSLVDLEKPIEISPPEEIASGGEASPITTGAIWDFERMEWIWSPCSYEEYQRSYNQDR